jgi:hypothetical protein
MNVYIYETRKQNYLCYYTDGLKQNGFNPIVIGSDILHSNEKYLDFYNLYEHYSDNSVDFELQCFARYFAISELHDSRDPFIISDSDIFITQYTKSLQEKLLNKRHTFIGSEGYDKYGSEKQISPHFSVWDKELLFDFIDYLFYIYRKNKQDNSLKREYIERKKRLFKTGISDMTILNAWILNNAIPFYNSNRMDDLGIDHNISSLFGHDIIFKNFLGRKVIKKDGNDFITISTSGDLQKMSIFHFQGRYKIALLNFYKSQMLPFLIKSIYINIGRNIKIRKSMMTTDIERIGKNTEA